MEQSNLHRQVIHGTADQGRPKADSAADRLRECNPHIKIVPYRTRLTAENALDIFADFDIVADGTDNFSTRYLVNDASLQTGIPNVYASIYRFDGQVSVLGTPGGPCYRCLFPEPPPPGLMPSCAEAGVLGVLPGIVGTIQATEVIKQLLGIGQSLIGRVLHVDALAMRFETMECGRDPDCAACGERPSIKELADYKQVCSTPEVIARNGVREVTVQELRTRLDGGETPLLLDVRTPLEAHIESLGGLLIPLAELPDRLEEIRDHQSTEIVVYCRVGERSEHAVRILMEAGFSLASSLAGGLAAWKTEIGSTAATL